MQRTRTMRQQIKYSELLRKELFMPTGLILIGGILVVAAGGLVFVLLRRQKAAEPPHFR
jgi:hypothetical protein